MSRLRCPLAASLVLLLVVGAASACASASPGQRVAAGEPPCRAPGPTRTLVISAFEGELRELRAAAEISETLSLQGRAHHVGRLQGHDVVLTLAGVSLVNAAMATQATLDRWPVGAILFSGIAGGVSPELDVGDVVVPEHWGQFQEMVFARETADGWDPGDRAGELGNFGMMFPRGQFVPGSGDDPTRGSRRFWFPVDADMLEVARRVAAHVELLRCTPRQECLEHTPRVVVGGNGVSGSAFVDNADFRRYLWDTFRAEAVDMETAAVAQVAFVNQVPFLGFRSLSDLAGGDPVGNRIMVFRELAAANSAAVLIEFLRAWPDAG